MGVCVTCVCKIGILRASPRHVRCVLGSAVGELLFIIRVKRELKIVYM